MKKHEESLRCFERAIEISPECGIAWESKAIALRALRRFSEAEEADALAKKLGLDINNQI
jgi:tetratricopeptide (TPR) repeat protein